MKFSDIHTTDSSHYLAVVTLLQVICVLCTVPHSQLQQSSKEDLLLTQLCHCAGGENMGGAQYCNERLEGLPAHLSLTPMQRL